MAKKQKTQKVVEPLIEKDFEEVETPVMEKPSPKEKKDTWKIKDRFYMLKGNSKPLSKLIKGCNVCFSLGTCSVPLRKIICDNL